MTLFSRIIAMSRQSEVYDAEMAGLAWAAIDIEEYLKKDVARDVRHLHFYADNTAAISAIFEAKPGPSQGQSRIFRSFAIRFLEANPEHRITVAWTPGHKGITGNERADVLAKEATERYALNQRATRANALRRAKERATNAWIAEWKKTHPTGRYATANRLPPQAKPRKLFLTLPREVFGRVVQCRTGHSFIGEYYKSFVPTEPVDCPCGDPYQTRRHILQDCPRYERFRRPLRAVSTTINLPTILGTEEGIDALAKFLEKSKAFTKSGDPPGERDEEEEQRERGDPENEADGDTSGEEDQDQDQEKAENEDDEE